MKLEVLRFNSSDATFTSGLLLFDVTDNVRSFLCYTMEDQAYNHNKDLWRNKNT